MNINEKTQTELIRIIKKKVDRNRAYLPSRSTLLAYAFLRNVPYIKLERVINEDKFPNQGNMSFLKTLSYVVADVIIHAAYGKSKYDIQRELYTASANANTSLISKITSLVSNSNSAKLDELKEADRRVKEEEKELGNSIFAWMQEKYVQEAEVKVA